MKNSKENKWHLKFFIKEWWKEENTLVKRDGQKYLWQITVRRSVAEESVCAATGDPSRFVLSQESPSLKIVWLHYADIGDVVEI